MKPIPLPEFPGYFADEDGNIYTTGRQHVRGKFDFEPVRMQPTVDKRWGHLSVTLKRGGKKKRFYVHQLILLTFVGSCPKGKLCCHINDISSDNRLENLKYGTNKENWKDRWENYRMYKKHYAESLERNSA